MNNPYQVDADKAQRLHLSHLLDHASASFQSESLPASFVKPSTYWSSIEKASFFASLARHSRWRPDLIAEDIGGGKSVADVCSYIELLDQKSRKRYNREAYPTAHEVSEEWIAVENEVSAELCSIDGERQEAASKRKRAQELKAVKHSLCSHAEMAREKGPGVHVESSPSRSHDYQMLDLAESEAWEKRFKARKQALTSLWKREDHLSSLDGRLLRTMDTMLLRDLEHSEAAKTMQEGGRLGLEDTGPGQTGVTQFDSNPDGIDSHIDPVLLSLDTGVSVPAPRSSPVSDSQKELHFLHTPSSSVDHIPQSMPPSSSPVAEISPTLSPASRRRLRKRLWTRCKRAKEKGLPTSEVSLDTTKLKCGRKAKLKTYEPGMPAKEDVSVTQSDMNDPTTPSKLSQPTTSHGRPHPGSRDDHANQAEDEGEVTDDSESTPVRKPYGWSKLTARQVSGFMLRTDGMDLFHLEKFADLTRLNTAWLSLLGHAHLLSAETDPFSEAGASSQKPSCVSYPLLRLLRACVVRFVTCLVAYVILHKDVEIRQKRRIHDLFETGGAEKIRSENVHEALLHMARHTSTKQLFTRLERTVRKALTASSEDRHCSDPRADGFDEMEFSDDGTSTEDTEDDDTSSMGILSLPFGLASQQAGSPPCDNAQDLGLSFWNLSALSTSGEMAGDSLLPEKMDQSQLRGELRAEEEVEKADREADRIHERELWKELGVERMELDNSMEVGGTNQEIFDLQMPENTEPQPVTTAEVGASHSPRLRSRGDPIKSREYVDSDEDW